jgi:large subunit ribosomal protein L30
MSETSGASGTQDKPKKKKDVDALLSEVTGAGAKSAPKKAEAKAAAKPAAEPKTIRIRQVKSGICTPVDQKLTLKGLGLRCIRHEVERPDTPTVRGQIRKVRHLVAVVGE